MELAKAAGSWGMAGCGLLSKDAACSLPHIQFLQRRDDNKEWEKGNQKSVRIWKFEKRRKSCCYILAGKC